MNSYLKKFLQENYALCEFVQYIDLRVQKLHYGELENDYISKHTSLQLLPPTDPLRLYYEQYGKTRDIYHKVTVEISKENAFSVTIREDHGDYYVFKLSRFQRGEIRYQVHYYPLQKILSCMCMLLEI